jgi:hypothetical protein
VSYFYRLQISNGHTKFITVHENPDDDIMHLLRFAFEKPKAAPLFLALPEAVAY